VADLDFETWSPFGCDANEASLDFDQETEDGEVEVKEENSDDEEDRDRESDEDVTQVVISISGWKLYRGWSDCKQAAIRWQ
jgi:hypothetical protein